MKLDKWPEEIECDGWRWAREYTPSDVKKFTMFHDTLPNGYYYRRIEKLHVPPTIKEILECWASGGTLRQEFNGDGYTSTIFSRLSSSLKYIEAWNPGDHNVPRWSAFNPYGVFSVNEGETRTLYTSEEFDRVAREYLKNE